MTSLCDRYVIDIPKYVHEQFTCAYDPTHFVTTPSSLEQCSTSSPNVLLFLLEAVYTHVL